MATIYALLIGINNYPVKPLSGCVNDVNAVEEYLQKMYGNDKNVSLNILRVTDQDAISPTRANIISAFDHFKTATGNDTCFLYYSGHGSYSPAPKEFWSEADMRSESFVCIDSRLPGGRDLMDKEMGYLIWNAMKDKKETRLVVITDCCHCGTITRDLDNSGITDRMMPDASGITDLKDYLGFHSDQNGNGFYNIVKDNTGVSGITFRQGNHIHLAASRENQTAKELNIDGTKRGAFTHSLLKTLYAVGGRITYRDLVKKTALLVSNIVSDQNPGLHVNGSENKDAADDLFLTKVSSNSNPFLVYYHARWKWCINAGLIHGVSTGDEINIEGIGIALISGTPAPDFSTIREVPGLIAGTSVYPATITRQPNQPLKVSFEPGFKHPQKALIEKIISEDKDRSLSLSKNDSGRFIIRSKGAEVFITKPGSVAPIIKPVLVVGKEEVYSLVGKIATVNRWATLLELTQSTFPARPYEINLYRGKVPGNYEPASFEKVKNSDLATNFFYLEDEAGQWHQPAFRLSIKNTGQLPLWISNAYLGFDYSVSTEFFEKIELLAPGNQAWLTFVSEGSEEDTVLLNLEEKYASLGYNEITEYLKLFISAQPIDTDRLKQDGIDMPVLQSRSAEERGLTSPGTKKSVTAFNWATETLGFRIIRPASKTTIAPGKPTILQSVVIAPHPGLRAEAALVSSDTVQRSLNATAAPHLTNQNSFLQPLDFGIGSRSAGQLDMIELTEVEDATVVTAETPLVLTVPEADLSDVVAIGYDEADGIYYPIGFGTDEGKIVIEGLPEPTPVDGAVNARSLSGSVKMYFQKIIGKRLGFRFDFPRLAIATVDENLNVSYEADPQQVTAAVASAKNILLFIHGIIGDTESIVKCIRTQTSTRSLIEKADLILCFDYENLNTRIEENAALLKEKLSAVGLMEGHSKQFTIVAHSMGGLVSRWFIEKLSGNKVVSKLVMLGTPNSGTPWADVRDMAESLLTFALNGAAFLKPWMFALNIAGKVVGGAQVALKQMDKDTGIYKTLNDGTDPGIPYVIIAGNTRDIIPNFDKTASALNRIFKRLRKRGLYDALDVLLFKVENDVAVTNKSITDCGNAIGWKQAPVTLTVPSDHMNYFNNKTALEKIL